MKWEISDRFGMKNILAQVRTMFTDKNTADILIARMWHDLHVSLIKYKEKTTLNLIDSKMFRV